MKNLIQLPRRGEIQTEYTWNAHAVFPSDDAWETAISQVEAQLQQFAGLQGRLSTSPSVLADFMDQLDTLLQQMDHIYIYASMFHEVDTADAAAAAKRDRARGLFSRVIAAISFAEPELLRIGFGVLEKWAKEDSRLTLYQHYYDSLKRRQAHVRSAEVEEVLGMVTDAFGTAAATHGILADADLIFEPAEYTNVGQKPLAVAQGTIDALLTHSDRGIRRTAWENYADAYLAHKNSMASCLAAGVKQQVFNSRVRRYGSALEAALAANYIPVDVFHNTVKTFRQNLSTWHRYWRVRRQALGYDRLHIYDIKAPLTAAKPTVSFEQAVDWNTAGMAPLGEEYVQIMRRGALEERWIDIYPNQGKRSGAFSTGAKGTHPYVLTNYNNSLFCMSTLVHELGHSMHSYYTWQNQPRIYSDYSIFAAEVASNFNQALVRDYLFREHTSPEFQIALIEEAMSNFHRYFFIMPTLARFELQIHQRVETGQALTADYLNALMADLFEEGFGQEVEFDRDRLGITWAQFPNHLYANFYVYQYTTGIAGAHALAARVLAGEPGAAENYLAFLRAGSSLYPLDALRMAGVDMASPEPVEETFTVLAGLVDRLESLMVAKAASK